MRPSSEESQRIGKFMSQLRDESGMNKNQVSKRTGLTRSTILNIENGNGATVDTVATLLGVYKSSWKILAEELDR